MKKISILLLTLSAFISASAELRYGFRFGGAIANGRLSDAPGYSVENKSGFSGGLVLEYQNPKCGFAADIAAQYTRYSASLALSDGDQGHFGRDFIEIPLHLKYKFWLKKSKYLFAPLVYTGPSAMFRLSHSHSLPMATKAVQPGWDVGIGFDAINFIQLTAGYRFGLTNAVSSFPQAPGSDFRSNAWTVSATILFDF